MAKRHMTATDLAHKVHWEGGVLAALEYGIRSEEINDPELAALWHQMEDLYDQLRTPVRVTDQMLRRARHSPSKPSTSAA